MWLIASFQRYWSANPGSLRPGAKDPGPWNSHRKSECQFAFFTTNKSMLYIFQAHLQPGASWAVQLHHHVPQQESHLPTLAPHSHCQQQEVPIALLKQQTCFFRSSWIYKESKYLSSIYKHYKMIIIEIIISSNFRQMIEFYKVLNFLCLLLRGPRILNPFVLKITVYIHSF